MQVSGEDELGDALARVAQVEVVDAPAGDEDRDQPGRELRLPGVVDHRHRLVAAAAAARPTAAAAGGDRIGPRRGAAAGAAARTGSNLEAGARRSWARVCPSPRSRRPTERRRRSRWCSIARTARWSTSSVAPERSASSAWSRRPPRMAAEHLERLRRERRAAPVGPAAARRPRRGRRPRGRPRRRTATQRVEPRLEPLEGQHLPEEGGRHERAVAGGQRAQRAEQHLVELRRSARAPCATWSTASSIVTARPSRSRSSRRSRKWSIVSAWVTMSSSRPS